MREIKFRAWNKHFGKMEEEVCINECGEVIHFDYGEYAGVTDDIVMQYTGLKDVNGTEIYEGDIVRFNDFWSEITGGNVGDTIRTCFVEYIMSGFFLRDVLDEEYEEDLGMALINDDEFEVIGNIYEHPHLLGD